MKERILAAYKRANEICYEASGGDLTVPQADQLILDKYLELGLIKLTKSKIGLQKEIYFPTLQDEAFDDLSGWIWLLIIQKAMKNHSIKSGIAKNSINEYVGKPWEYNIDDCKVITVHEAGPRQVREEEAAWKEIKEEEDGK